MGGGALGVVFIVRFFWDGVVEKTSWIEILDEWRGERGWGDI